MVGACSIIFGRIFDTQLYLLAKGTPMAAMGYKELTDRKTDFEKMTEISL
jgi:hypothetical protein